MVRPRPSSEAVSVPGFPGCVRDVGWFVLTHPLARPDNSAMGVTKLNSFIGFVALDVTKPYEFIGLVALPDKDG